MTLEANIIALVPLTRGTATVQEGATLFSALAPNIKDGNVVRLSLHGATAMSSSFLHASIGRLIDEYGVDSVVKYLRLVDYKPDHAKMIKNYIAQYR